MAGRTHKDGSRTSLGAVLEDSACGFGRPGVCPVSSVQMRCGLAQDLFLRCLVQSGLVETRRLELLTLSLQRRCSAN
jgi:hypothetical protein